MMNNSNVSGKLDQVVGKVKQGVGEAVGNENLANEGLAQQAKGAAKETWGNVKDAANETADNAKISAAEHRDSLSQKIDNAKATINEKIDNFRDRHKDERAG